MNMTKRVSPAPLIAEAKTMFMVSNSEYTATKRRSTIAMERIGRNPSGVERGVKNRTKNPGTRR